MSLKEIARQTLDILNNGEYFSPSGKIIRFASEQQAAMDGTELYTPQQAHDLLLTGETKSQILHKSDEVDSKLVSTQKIEYNTQMCIEVTDETTQVAAHRLVQLEGCSDLVLLNYASARNPGGGFINGAKAQEEDLARCSGLYPCLLKQPLYYETNREQRSLLYTDHIIYSPNVPWFRTHSRNLLEEVFLASVITAPAPNAGQILLRDPQEQRDIEQTIRRRAGLVLAVARKHGHRNLILGAWGCGAFRNDPVVSAEAFGFWLEHAEFQGCFDRVVFAVYDTRPQQKNLRAFQSRFPT
jgi:uncharacterized protein (TIGR02452 family)